MYTPSIVLVMSVLDTDFGMDTLSLRIILLQNLEIHILDPCRSLSFGNHCFKLFVDTKDARD